MTTYPATFIASERQEAEKLIVQLNAVGGLEVSYFAPVPDLNLSRLAANTQLFLVDWELDKLQETGMKANYNGGLFALKLRQQFRHVPIVLTGTNEALSEWEWLNAHLFDASVKKTEMMLSPEQVVTKCLSLVTGYQALVAAEKSWNGLISLLGANEFEAEKIGEAAPPLLRKNGQTSWQLLPIVKWLEEVLLAYPGILYDAQHAAAFLGIAEEAFMAAEVQERLRETRYDGPLAPPDGRWWKNKLYSMAYEMIFDAGNRDPWIHEHFAWAYQELYGKALEPSICVYSGKKHAPYICYLLKKPVRIEDSLAYLPDYRPRVMDYARVSFTAIRNFKELLDEHFPISTRHLAEDIRSSKSDEL